MSFWKYWLKISAGLSLSLSLLFLGCQKKGTAPDPNIGRGKALYHAACTACHHSDPKKEGSLGPPVWGASFMLLKKRIQEGTYPEGYQPKRTTKLMQPLPHLSEEDVRAIYVYLNQD